MSAANNISKDQIMTDKSIPSPASVEDLMALVNQLVTNIGNNNWHAAAETKDALRTEVTRLATQRQGEGENRKIAQLIIYNDRAGAVKWATGLIGNFDGPSCRIDPDATSQGVAVARPDAREAALEQAANLVECEYAHDKTQAQRLAQIAQHIRDLKKRGV